MKKIVIYILLIFLNLNIANSNERSEKEIKLGVFLDELGLTDEEKEKISYTNGAKLLGLSSNN